MNQPFSQSVSFKLDKAHFQECFEQSAQEVQIKDYYKAIILGVLSISLFFVEAEHYYFPFFLFCLGVLEILSVKYRQTWWVWRQLMSKSANATVELIFDDDGITTISKQVNSQILWNDINSIKQTKKGFLLKHKNGVNYLSNSYINEEMKEFILNKTNM